MSSAIIWKTIKEIPPIAYQPPFDLLLSRGESNYRRIQHAIN